MFKAAKETTWADLRTKLSADVQILYNLVLISAFRWLFQLVWRGLGCYFSSVSFMQNFRQPSTILVRSLKGFQSKSELRLRILRTRISWKSCSLDFSNRSPHFLSPQARVCNVTMISYQNPTKNAKFCQNRQWLSNFNARRRRSKKIQSWLIWNMTMATSKTIFLKSTDNTSTRNFLGCFLLLMKNLSHLKLIAIQNTLISLTLKMIKYLKKWRKLSTVVGL